MRNETFSALDVAGSTPMGIVTNPKLMEPFTGRLRRQLFPPDRKWDDNGLRRPAFARHRLFSARRFHPGPARLLDQSPNQRPFAGQSGRIRESAASFHSSAKAIACGPRRLQPKNASRQK
jgi:hypothetical protein